MNYFLRDVFLDMKWWARIAFVVVVIINAADILSSAFASPGFSNMWVFKITLISTFIGLIAYGTRLYRREEINRQIEALLPAFVTERRAFLEKMAAENPKFQTFCHECDHYDVGLMGCRLPLHDRQTKIKLQSQEVQTYCLYWNLKNHPLLPLTKSKTPKNGAS